jgi:hypothetical protein
MPPKPLLRCQAITNMIESVAQEQAALGRILCAEADKLDKIISMTCGCPQELLKANRSVDRLINSVFRLEMVLQAKLEMFEDCLCTCSPHPMDAEVE